MAIKKQTFVMSVVFNEEETHSKSAVEAISHRLFNEDGIIENTSDKQRHRKAGARNQI